MNKKSQVTFEEIFKQNERRIHYHIQKQRIQDPHHEFCQESLYATWQAYKTLQPDKGTLSTYFNHTIRKKQRDGSLASLERY